MLGGHSPVLRHLALSLSRLLNQPQTRRSPQNGLELEQEQESGEERPHRRNASPWYWESQDSRANSTHRKRSAREYPQGLTSRLASRVVEQVKHHLAHARPLRPPVSASRQQIPGDV
jgi:hypothetical protein